MHKKYYNHKDHRHHHSSSPKRGEYLKTRKRSEDSAWQITNVPQNSKNELFSTKLEIGEYEGKEKFKSYKDKHKHRHREEVRLKDHRKHEKLHKVMDIQGLVLDKDGARRKEKRDKDRLNKIEKYFEGVNKENKRFSRHRSLSLESSEDVLRHKERHMRREKTFQDKLERDATPRRKEREIITTSREKLEKKRKPKEHRKRESSKENNTKNDLETVMYCQVETQSPFKQVKKKPDIERLYPKPTNKASIIMTQVESAQKEKHKQKAPLKCSPRKSKVKIETRRHREKCSDASLTNKYSNIVVDKKSQVKLESSHQRKKKHQKQDIETNVSRLEKKNEVRDRSKSEKTRMKHEKTSSPSDPYKVKIEDDIKSYFSKIQTLIDKKLDFILGNSASKETKSNATQDKSDKQRRKKENIAEMKPEKPARERSCSKRQKRNGRSKTSEDGRRGEKIHVEETRTKLSQAFRASKRTRERTESNISIDTELYPPENAYNRRHRRSSHKRHDHSPEVVTHFKLSGSEENDIKMKPERLIKMLEHPSSFSLSNHSLANNVVVQEVKQKPKELQLAGNVVECHRKREAIQDAENTQQVFLQEALIKKYKHKPQIDVSKIGPALNVSQHEENHHKRESSVARRNIIPPDNMNMADMEQELVQDKKLKKQLRQFMNLECKTISIVGIPSQVRESTIFNETQTTTSLNIPLEDSIEQKKKSKRFKLYYKYSMADNKCPSDKSSVGMKSGVSESYRMVSDPSDNNIEDWEEDNDVSKDENKGRDAEVTRYLFNMHSAKTKNLEMGEHSPKKYRKRVDTLKPIALNNIVEEPSNISVTIRRNGTGLYSKKDVNCTFFKSLKSSSSDCILGRTKTSVQKWNIPPHKHKHRNIEESLDKYYVRSRSSSKRSPVKSNVSRKLKKILSHERIQTESKKNKIKYTSRSDIDISYDSLKQANSKGKQNSNTSDYIKEQLKEILPTMFTQNPGPIRDSLDVILKEELKEFVKEIPINIHRKMSVDNLMYSIVKPDFKKEDNYVENLKDTLAINSIEVNTTESLEEQKLCSKKRVSETGTRIPILMKGFMATQVTSAELIEAGSSKHDGLETAPVKQSEKTLVSVATDISIDRNRRKIMEIALENKLSQTPNYEDRLKKSTAVGDYKIRNPIVQHEPKVISPTTNSVNCQFPSGKQGSNKRRDRPNSAHSSRPKSSASEKRGEKFEAIKSTETHRHSNRRHLTAQSTYSELPNTLKSKRKATLTMSTNVITINTPQSVERGTGPIKLTAGKDEYINNVKTGVEESKTCDGEDLESNVALSLDYFNPESRIGSLACVDRQSNTQKTNFSSNSRSLDQYTTKSTIGDNQRSGRLFFTKSFYPEMNTYQRRKVYDENIRRKMRKKNGSQSHMGPRVFEVRYLTLENANLGKDLQKPPVINKKCFTKMPTFGSRINKGKQKAKVVKKCRKNFPMNKEDACKYSGRDIFAPIITDVDQLNRFRRKNFPEKNENKSTVNEGNDNAKQSLKVSETKSEAVETASLTDPKQNFKSLMDCLYNSILTYCNTKFELPQAEKESGEKVPSLFNRRSYIVSSKTSNDSFQIEVNDEEKRSKSLANRIGSHLSCPVLAGSTSSFDYLYEDSPIDMSKETILLHFGKPRKTILGYAFNNTRLLNREPLRNPPRRFDQMSSCATQSEESGYSSNQSKKCASVCSFFKRSSIVNLFKPVSKLETYPPSTGSVSACRSGPNLQQYNTMNQKCIEYAEKVRIQSQNNHKPKQSFQEIPLDVLLFCRKNSEFFNDFNSNCSLCQQHSILDSEIDDEMRIENDNDVLNIKRSSHNSLTVSGNSELIEKEIHPETLIDYEDSTQRPPVEIITFQKSHSIFSIKSKHQLTSEIVKCPLIVSITNLNPCSLTVIEEPGANSSSIVHFNKDNVMRKQECNTPMKTHSSTELIEVDSNPDLKYLATTDEDIKSDIFSAFTSSTPSAINKYHAKRFFDNLLKVYEKEMNLSNRLFRDDDFFLNVLLAAVNAEISKTKNVSLKSFFKNKIKSVFSSKNEVEAPKLRQNPLNTHQKELQLLASDARRYFSMYVEAVRINSGINDEVKICGLLKLLERIEDGDFAILRKKEDVDFEEEIKEQMKQAFVKTYNVSLKEAKKRKRRLTEDDLNLIRTFVSKYRIGLLSNTNLIATYIGRGVLKTENHLKSAVTYLIQQNNNKDIDLKDFEAHCKSLKCSE